MLVANGNRMLIIAPHPDDEIIGCGGLIARAKRSGMQVFVLFGTVADTEDYSERGFSSCAERKCEIAKVAAFMAFDDYDILLEGGQYHLRLDLASQRDLITLLDSGSSLSLQSLQPDVVLLPQPTSYNQDHRAWSHAALTALRPCGTGFRHQPRWVLAYEEWSDQWPGTASAPNIPSVSVELAPQAVERKLDALRLYSSQCRDRPDPRSCHTLSAQAVARGSQFGYHAAEAFACLRYRCAASD